MWAAIELLETNLAMSFENMVILIMGLGGFLFYAKDVKIGIIIHFVMFSGIFMGFYALGWSYGTALILALCFLILLSMTLLINNKAQGAVV